jgi:hypothetical protein
LKRFVKDVFDDFSYEKRINPKVTSIRSILLLYILFIVGKHDEPNIDQKILNDLIKNNLEQYSPEYRISEELSQKLINDIICSDGYDVIIERGARIIDAWK